jgi:hypothetical protein
MAAPHGRCWTTSISRELDLVYRNGILRAGTYGRGAFTFMRDAYVDLAGLSEPIKRFGAQFFANPKTGG